MHQIKTTWSTEKWRQELEKAGFDTKEIKVIVSPRERNYFILATKK